MKITLWVRSWRRSKGHMEALLFARKREHSTVESVPKKIRI